MLHDGVLSLGFMMRSGLYDDCSNSTKLLIIIIGK